MLEEEEETRRRQGGLLKRSWLAQLASERISIRTYLRRALARFYPPHQLLSTSLLG